jgi:D-glycero-D-manno-heptose 1,7-bisphosphate phosphatase
MLTRVRHVILDRDGVLNEEAPDRGYIRSPDEWRWIPGALEGLAMLSRAGVRVSIATNQSGVGRGIMSEADLARVHEQMNRDVQRAGGSIDAVFACMHAPDAGCACRKPAPGLIEAAIDASGIARENALVVGDDMRDLEAARAAGVPAVLVLTGKGKATAARVEAADGPQVSTYNDLAAFARQLTMQSR